MTVLIIGAAILAAIALVGRIKHRIRERAGLSGPRGISSKN